MKNVSVFASISLENVTVNAFLTWFWPLKIIDKPEILFLRGFILNSAASRWRGHIQSQHYFCSRNPPPGAMASQVQDNWERRSVVKDCPQFECHGKNQCLKSLRGQLEAGIHTWKKDQSRSRRVSKWDLPRRIWSRSGDGRNNSALRRPWPWELQTVWQKEEQSIRNDNAISGDL